MNATKIEILEKAIEIIVDFSSDEEVYNWLIDEQDARPYTTVYEIEMIIKAAKLRVTAGNLRESNRLANTRQGIM